MTFRTLTRSALVFGVLGLSALAAAPAFAARNAEAERYVQENGTAALRALADTTGSATQRRQTFQRLMTQFADMPRIANFVLGRFGPQVQADASLRAEWLATFQDYAIAVYEDRLQQYAGTAIEVTGSVERTAGRDVIVQSRVTPRGGGRAMPVQWRLISRNGQWKVVDVALVNEGREIWLAAQQQGEFAAALGRSNGDVRALIGMLRQQTAAMRA